MKILQINKFFFLKGGANVGDVTIGNYAGGSGILWDKSGGALTVLGTITAGAGSSYVGNAIAKQYIGVLDAGNISVANLAAISASMGTVNVGGANDVNGILNLYDASSNLIIKADKTGHHYYNTGGTELVQINSSGLITYGTSGDVIKFYNQSGGTLYGSMGYHSGTGSMYTLTGANTNLYMIAKNDAVLSADDTIIIEADDDDNSAGDVALIGDLVAIKSKGYDNSFALYSGSVYKQILISDTGGTTSIQRAGSTAKTAVVETSKGYKALYCTESPEVWFTDFCENKDKIDPLFLEVTEAPYHYIKCEGGEYQVWGKRKGFNQRFEDKTKGEFERNNNFWNVPNIPKTKIIQRKLLKRERGGKRIIETIIR